VYCEEAIARRRFLRKVFESLCEELQRRQWNDELDRLAAPTLIIWGRHDRLIDVSCTEIMRARIPNNHCVVFEDAGHIPMLECPAEAAAVHLEHLLRRRD
jgi:pimeloyl-ACP methyl ester carboxylesterase